jgi:hypothetical protein
VRVLKKIETRKSPHPYERGFGVELSLRRPTIFVVTYLLTFNCYGTHLPGDVRGSVDRLRGADRGGYLTPSTALVDSSRRLMQGAPYKMDWDEAYIVLTALHEVCAFRHWNLLAAHVRTTHVHVVVGQISDANRTIADFKAYASRALNSRTAYARRWAREGSTRPLRTGEAIRAAIRYVVESQGRPMAVYVSGSL